VNETLYTEKLAWFKHNAKPEAVLVIADNLELIKIIIAWPNLEVKLPKTYPNLKVIRRVKSGTGSGKTHGSAWLRLRQRPVFLILNRFWNKR
jgi:hypothetical protein